MAFNQIDEFYKNVLRSFQSKMHSKNEIAHKFEEQQIDAIVQKLNQKLKNTSILYRKLTHDYNEIQKQMLGKAYEIEYASKIIEQKVEKVLPMKRSEESQEDDLNLYENEENPADKQNEQEQKNGDYQIEDILIKKIKSDDSSSIVDLKDISSDQIQTPQTNKRLREGMKIHILGTYDSKIKKFNSKKEETKFQLENVFIKAQNMEKQMIFSKMGCTIQKTYNSFI